MLGKPGKPLVELHPRLPILCLRTGHQREDSQLSVRFIPSVKLTSYLFRFELLEIMRASGMKTQGASGPSGQCRDPAGSGSI